MKHSSIVRNLAVAAVVAAIGLGAAGAGAQTQQAPRDRDQMQQRDQMQRGQQRQTFQPPAGTVESRRLIGTRVMNAQGKQIGEIDQLLVDATDGKISHAVIGVGGFLGVGESHLVVPWSEVRLSQDPSDRQKMVARMDQATLEQAPRYQRTAGREGERSPATSPRTEPSPRGTTGSGSTTPGHGSPGSTSPGTTGGSGGMGGSGTGTGSGSSGSGTGGGTR